MEIFKSKHRGFTLPDDFVPAGETLLNLQYNNSNVDTSDSPKPVTVIGTETYTDGKYGELLSARTFDGFEADTYDMSGEYGNLGVYTVSGWIRNRVNSSATNGTINSLHSRDYLDVINFNGAIRFFNDNMSSNWYLTVIYGDKNELDPLPQKGRAYPLGNIENIYIYVAVSFDTPNNELRVLINNVDITENYDNVNFTTFDANLTSMEYLPADRDAIVGGRSVTSNFLTNCDIYTTVVRNYYATREELKAEYKYYQNIFHIFNGNNYIDITDEATKLSLSNLDSGRIICNYTYTENSNNLGKYSRLIGWAKPTVSGVDQCTIMFNETANSTAMSCFIRIDDSTKLYFYINDKPLFWWNENKTYDIDVIFNGVNSSITIDGVLQNITFITSNLRFSSTVGYLFIGNGPVYTDSLLGTSVSIKGKLNALRMTDVNDTIDYYTFENPTGAKIISSGTYEIK